MKLTKAQVLSLVKETIKARKNAYAPYSKFKVGALLVDDKGRKFPGVNVENGSYGATICAERTAVFTAVANGMKKIKLLVVVGDTPGPIPPCGMCRQVIAEFSDAKTQIVMANLKGEYRIVTKAELLPFPFEFDGPGNT
jgi:cytidine deaminase